MNRCKIFRKALTKLLSISVINMFIVGTVVAEKTISFNCLMDESSVEKYKLSNNYESEYAKNYTQVNDRDMAEQMTINAFQSENRVLRGNYVIDRDYKEKDSSQNITWEPAALTIQRFMGQRAVNVRLDRTDLSYSYLLVDASLAESEMFERKSGTCVITDIRKRQF